VPTGTQPGHRPKNRDCPGEIGTLGNYELVKLLMVQGESLVVVDEGQHHLHPSPNQKTRLLSSVEPLSHCFSTSRVSIVAYIAYTLASISVCIVIVDTNLWNNLLCIVVLVTTYLYYRGLSSVERSSPSRPL
jgi:hypothetical protein